jgi:hypothetical protein
MLKCHTQREPDIPYNAPHAAAWIINVFIDHLRAEDLDALKRMIAADLAYAYELGKRESLATAGTD